MKGYICQVITLHSLHIQCTLSDRSELSVRDPSPSTVMEVVDCEEYAPFLNTLHLSKPLFTVSINSGENRTRKMLRDSGQKKGTGFYITYKAV